MKRIKILLGYKDLELNRAIGMGETLLVKDNRAEYLVSLKIAQIIEHIEEEEPVADLSQPLKTPAGIRAKKEVDNKEIKSVTVTKEIKAKRTSKKSISK